MKTEKSIQKDLRHQPFKNRREAGKKLTKALQAYRHKPDILVLALPRGGVPVAFEIAKDFQAALDVFLVRKLGVPGHEELAMGAVSNGGSVVLNRDVIDALGLSMPLVSKVAEREKAEIKRRESIYRKGLEAISIENKTLILVDDGLATGSTMLAALHALRAQKPASIVAAVPVAPPSTCEQLPDDADDMICLMTPESFYGVGQWYEDFSQTSDSEVIELLQGARAWTKNAGKTSENPHQNQGDHPDLHS